MSYALEVSEKEIKQMVKSGISINKIDKNGYNLFHLAVINNITDVIKLLLNKDVIIDERANDGCTALHIAIKLKQKKIINLLLKNGANVNAKNIIGKRSLHLAVLRCYFDKIITNSEKGVLPTAKLSNIDKVISKLQQELHTHGRTLSYTGPSRDRDGYLHENLNIIKLLVTHGADINAKDFNNMSSFHWAVRLGLYQTTDFFLQNGAKATVLCSDGYYPIYDALRANDVELVNLLLNYVRIPDVPDFHGNTPLFYAMKLEFEDIIKLLLQKGADINNPAASLLHKAVQANDTKMIQLLFKYGANANVTDRQDCAPLHYAMRLGLGQVGEFLLKQGAEINAPGKNGWTPLIEAVKCRNTDMVLLLLDHGVDVNVYDETHATALHHAIKLGLKQIAELLLDNGAWIEFRDPGGLSPLNEAVRANDTEMVSLLVKHGADVNGRDDLSGNVPLHYAVKMGFCYVTGLLLENGARINELKKSQDSAVCDAMRANDFDTVNLLIKHWTNNPQDNSLLRFAIKASNSRIVKLLLENGARVHRFENEIFSPLHEAVQANDEESIKLLLDYGADVNAFDLYGFPPLYCAIRLEYKRIVELLLSRNADVNRRDNNGRTPLFAAAMINNEQILILLLSKGADLNVEDNDGMSPFDLADYLSVDRIMTKRLAMIDPSKLCAGNLRALGNKCEKIQSLYIQSRFEIEKMKTCKLGYKTILYDVFKYDRLLSHDALNTFKSVIHENHFSCYSQELLKVYNNCFMLRQMFDQAESKLDFFWNHFKLPQLVSQKIMNFFEFKDFVGIIDRKDILAYNLMSTEH